MFDVTSKNESIKLILLACWSNEGHEDNGEGASGQGGWVKQAREGI